ncbi:hypothetical protein BDB00DRAFT_876151 [Zychaea mexicana]|nr:uncharacterized protein BDB00DRAFT_876151 [Zychaea mexicana]KAI9489602.1 hypothetical protein BDB00DRAFT_876151 [Zychaea mexicana]
MFASKAIGSVAVFGSLTCFPGIGVEEMIYGEPNTAKEAYRPYHFGGHTL